MPATKDQACLAAEMCDYMVLHKVCTDEWSRAKDHKNKIDGQIVERQLGLDDLPSLQHFVLFKHNVPTHPSCTLLVLFSTLRVSCMLLFYIDRCNWLSWMTLDHLHWHTTQPNFRGLCTCSALDWNEAFHTISMKLTHALYSHLMLQQLKKFPVELVEMVLGYEARLEELKIAG